MGLRDDLERAGGAVYLDRVTRPEAYGIDRITEPLHKVPKPTDPFERLAEHFMQGLQAQANELSKGLKDNQQLLMYCYHGYEKLRVLSINMPSMNVVAMHCVDADDRETHVTGHLHAVTFSFVIDTLVPPEVRKPIGFNMPS
jgi:hypothetical protein